MSTPQHDIHVPASLLDGYESIGGRAHIEYHSGLVLNTLCIGPDQPDRACIWVTLDDSRATWSPAAIELSVRGTLGLIYGLCRALGVHAIARLNIFYHTKVRG